MQCSAQDVSAVRSINTDTEGPVGLPSESGFLEPISDKSHRPAYIVSTTNRCRLQKLGSACFSSFFFSIGVREAQ